MIGLLVGNFVGRQRRRQRYRHKSHAAAAEIEKGAKRVGSVFVFSLTAVLNPTLLAAVTLMLTLPSTIAATETP